MSNKGIDRSRIEEHYIGSEELLARFAGQTLNIYGAGTEGELFILEFSGKLTVQRVIDSHRIGETFYDHIITGFNDCEELLGSPLIITSWKYRSEIFDIISNSIIKDEDIYIWDRGLFYVIDKATNELITWNNEHWRTKENTGKNRILIPFENIHDVSSVMYAYVANYLCEKYDARMECYKRYSVKEVSKSVYEVYKSFGAETIVDQELSFEQLREAQQICETIWSGIVTFSDWKDITIYGIRFGTTIIRCYLRFYIPYEDPKDERYYEFLLECVKTVVFWKNRFEQYDYKSVVLWDGVHWEGFIRDIALSKGIPTYMVFYNAYRKLHYNETDCGGQYKYYKTFWDQLTEKEKHYGLEWAKNHLGKRLLGIVDDYRSINDPFAANIQGRVLEKNDKLKVLICPHSFEEDSFLYGDQVFDDNYFSWLCHLGELSESITKYDWYLKIHPHSSTRDHEIIDAYLSRYTHIKKIDALVSPRQLKNEGIKYALTVQGTIGHEYPLLGIQVINAGINPHIAFDFDWNPKTKEEYDQLMYNLDMYEKKINKDEIFQYYAMNYFFYDHNKRLGCPFFDVDELNKDNHKFWIEQSNKKVGTWKYQLFLDTCDEEEDKRLMKRAKEIFDTMNEWQEDIFYRREQPV